MGGSNNSRKGTRKGKQMRDAEDSRAARKSGRTARRGYLAHASATEGAYGGKPRYDYSGMPTMAQGAV